mgnify:CR=1 FL=1
MGRSAPIAENRPPPFAPRSGSQFRTRAADRCWKRPGPKIVSIVSVGSQSHGRHARYRIRMRQVRICERARGSIVEQARRADWKQWWQSPVVRSLDVVYAGLLAAKGGLHLLGLTLRYGVQEVAWYFSASAALAVRLLNAPTPETPYVSPSADPMALPDPAWVDARGASAADAPRHRRRGSVAATGAGGRRHCDRARLPRHGAHGLAGSRGRI